mgnify:CR=1 FL=1
MTFKEFVNSIMDALSGIVVPTIITLAFLVFIYGIVQYFFIGGQDPESRAKGRNFIVWGAMGLALMFSTWALVRIFLSTLGILQG